MPHFDSPSIFARILDKDKVSFAYLHLADNFANLFQGGHFSITPTIPFSTKQAYLPSSNVRWDLFSVPIQLITSLYVGLTNKVSILTRNPVRRHPPHISHRFLNEQGVVSVIGQVNSAISCISLLIPPIRLPAEAIEQVICAVPSLAHPPCRGLLLRHTDPRLLTIHHALVPQVIRGAMPIRMECAPAFNYARSAHDTTLVPDTSVQPPLGLASPTSPSPSTPAQLKALFSSPGAELTLDLRYIAEASADATSAGVPTPRVQLRRLDLSARGHKGPGVFAEMDLVEGQAVTFILRTPPDEPGAAEGREQAGHHEVSHDRARELGIPLERLVLAKSKLRAPEDPVLTRVRAFNSMVSEVLTKLEPEGAFA